MRPERAAAQARPPTRPNHILVVEDDAEIREAVQMILEEDGLTASLTRNGKEALEWLQMNGEPALILLDLMMPVMDGRTFLQRLIQLGTKVPVVVMSAQSRLDVPDATAVLAKPFEIDVFLAMIRRHLPEAK